MDFSALLWYNYVNYVISSYQVSITLARKLCRCTLTKNILRRRYPYEKIVQSFVLSWSGPNATWNETVKKCHPSNQHWQHHRIRHSQFFHQRCSNRINSWNEPFGAFHYASLLCKRGFKKHHSNHHRCTKNPVQ